MIRSISVLFVALGAAPASADIVQLTLTGTIYSGTRVDFTGHADNLSGQSVTETFTFNTARGVVHQSPGDNLLAGSGATSPVINYDLSLLGQTLTVNSFSSSTVAGFSGPVPTNPPSLLSQRSVTVAGSSPANVSGTETYNATSGDNIVAGGLAFPASLTANFTYDASNATAHWATVSFSDRLRDPTTGNVTELYRDDFSYSVDTITERDIQASAAPEASTWAMITMGFVGLGLLGRLSARRTAPAA